MPKRFSDAATDSSWQLTPVQQATLKLIQGLLEQVHATDTCMWSCFPWRRAEGSHRRTYLGRDDLVRMLDAAVLILRAQGYWWPMIGIVVRSRAVQGKRRQGRWHVHILEIGARHPSRRQREMIFAALRAAGFSDVRFDDLTLERSELPWWKARKEARESGHQGYRHYAAKNVAEHDSETPFAVYRASNVSGPQLPGEEVAREILRAARAKETPGQARVDGSARRKPPHRRAPRTSPRSTKGTSAQRSPAESVRASVSSPQLELGRQALVGLRLVSARQYTHENKHGWPQTRYIHLFRDAQGRRYRWAASNPRPATVRGYRHAGRYWLLPGEPLTFDATVCDIRPGGTVVIQRPYIRLDLQPEATRRAYSEGCDLRLADLRLEPRSASVNSANLAEAMTKSVAT